MYRAIAAALLATSSLSAARSETPDKSAAVDLVLERGHIYLGEGAWAESIAIKDGKVVSAGRAADLAALRKKARTVRNLAGRTVIPGLVDIHVHPLVAAKDLLGYRCNFSAYSTVKEILARVEACAATARPDEWIIGEYWSGIVLAEISTPQALAALDKAGGGRPVMLGDDTTHNRWVSTAAMRIAGVTASTPDPAGGHILRDAKGQPLGVFIERPASSLIENVTPVARLTKDYPVTDLLHLSVRKLNGYGVTSFLDARVNDDEVRQAYASLDKSGLLTARVGLMTMFDRQNLGDPSAVMKQADRTASAHVGTRYAKLYLDGVMTTRTAAFIDPYLADDHGHPGDHGTLNIPISELAALTTRLDAMNVVIKFHAAGDAAVREALDAVQVARTLNNDKGPIHQIAHVAYVKPDDLERFAPLRVAVDASPTIWFPGPIVTATAKVIGDERAYHPFPFATMLQKGITIAGGTDWKTLPDEQSYIWAGIGGMVTRRNPSGKAPGALWPEQAITVGQAIDAYTMGAATAMGLAGEIGSLAPGKFANLAILDRDIFSVKPDEISKTQVVETIFEGRVVYKRGDPDPVYYIIKNK